MSAHAIHIEVLTDFIGSLTLQSNFRRPNRDAEHQQLRRARRHFAKEFINCCKRNGHDNYTVAEKSLTQHFAGIPTDRTKRAKGSNRYHPPDGPKTGELVGGLITFTVIFCETRRPLLSTAESVYVVVVSGASNSMVPRSVEMPIGGVTSTRAAFVTCHSI